MSDQTAKKNDNTIDKEKTVKKRAARSIVAPRIEEEVRSDVSSAKNSTYIPGHPRPRREDRKPVTIVSPAAVHSEPGKMRTPKVISAPTGVVMNEDKLPPEVKKIRSAPTATGWPERPPQPRVPKKDVKPAVTAGPVKSNAVPDPVKPSAAPQAAKAPDKNTGVATGMDAGTLKPGDNRSQTVSVINDKDGVPRKVIKTVVTTTTTTYEEVTEDELKNPGIQQPQQSQGTYTQGTAQPVPQQPARSQPGIIPEPVINRAAVQSQTQPVTQVKAQPATQVQGAAPVKPQPSQTQGAAPVQPSQVQGVAQAQPSQVQGAVQPQSVQTQNPVQVQGVQVQTAQPSQPQQPGIRVIAQPQTAQKPMTAMDRQLAEIEKALGLSGDASGQGTGMQGVQPVQQPLNVAVPAASGNPQTGQPYLMQGVQPTDLKGNTSMDAQTKKTMEYFMLALEGLIFVIVLCVCISIYQKIKNKDYAGGPDDNTSYEQDIADNPDANASDSGTESFDVQQAGEGDELQGSANAGTEDILAEDILEDQSAGPAQTSDSIDVENERFSLHCTNITVTLDTNGSPVALIYFTFTNKTGEQLAMSDVFPPSVVQNGEPCDTSASLEQYPEEFYNKDMKISDGSTLNCCYAVTLKDAVSPIRLTVHDNYETFADIGTTEIAIQ